MKTKYPIPNRIEDIGGIISKAIKPLEKYCTQETLMEIETGLYEVVLNAIEHGNLSISFSEKANALQANKYKALLCKRMKVTKYKNRKATLRYRLNSENVCFLVEDQGDGFDKEAYLKRYKKSFEELNSNGRGILLAEMFFDKVQYNRKGNKVILLKRFARK